MRILSLNIWHGFQKEQLRDFLLSEVEITDIFCFQEAVGSGAEEVIAGIFDDNRFQAVVAEKFIEENKHYYLMTIVKKPLAISHSYGLLADDDTETGKALAVEVATNDGDTLTIVNIHGMPHPGHKLDTEGRLRQSQQIIDALSGSKTIVCGDFNLLPETESVKMFSRVGYRNLVAEYAIPTTRNELAWAPWPDNKQLFADYSFVSPDINITHFAVPHTEASDHLPMMIDIT